MDVVEAWFGLGSGLVAMLVALVLIIHLQSRTRSEEDEHPEDQS